MKIFFRNGGGNLPSPNMKENYKKFSKQTHPKSMTKVKLNKEMIKDGTWRYQEGRKDMKRAKTWINVIGYLEQSLKDLYRETYPSEPTGL